MACPIDRTARALQELSDAITDLTGNAAASISFRGSKVNLILHGNLEVSIGLDLNNQDWEGQLDEEIRGAANHTIASVCRRISDLQQQTESLQDSLRRVSRLGEPLTALATEAHDED